MDDSMEEVTVLVTDKIRRTVKFMCAVARGLPIVSDQWLLQCKSAGSKGSLEFFYKLIRKKYGNMRFPSFVMDCVLLLSKLKKKNIVLIECIL